MAFNELLSYIVAFLISLLLFNIIASLSDKHIFTNQLYKRFRFMGYLIIGHSIFQLLYSIILSSWYGHIGMQSSSLNNKIDFVNNISINPSINFSFTYLITGLGLIVLVYFLKYANWLEKEQDLTI